MSWKWYDSEHDEDYVLDTHEMTESTDKASGKDFPLRHKQTKAGGWEKKKKKGPGISLPPFSPLPPSNTADKSTPSASCRSDSLDDPDSVACDFFMFIYIFFIVSTGFY